MNKSAGYAQQPDTQQLASHSRRLLRVKLQVSAGGVTIVVMITMMTTAEKMALSTTGWPPILSLSPMFASHVISHAIVREQAWPAQLCPEELVRLVPAIERAIRPFLRREEGDRVIASLHIWVAGLFQASRMPVDPRSATSTPP